MLTQLFTGRFIPRTLPHMETHTPGGGNTVSVYVKCPHSPICNSVVLTVTFFYTAHYRMREPEHLPLPPISQLRISQPSLPTTPQPRTPTTPQQGAFQTPRPGALQPHVPFQHPVPQTLPQQEALTSQPRTFNSVLYNWRADLVVQLARFFCLYVPFYHFTPRCYRKSHVHRVSRMRKYISLRSYGSSIQLACWW